ncbi:MAG: cysteine--tRNA ligase, partial [Peptococcaceae bacterium]|nr:cysteine--tRNA ligase [Peptococcaceae bacterium]
LRRYLEYKGNKVKYVSNITDVDDKIIKRSIEEGITFEAVARKYEDEYYHDLQGLNVRFADVRPRVSDHIPEIIDIVQTLVDKRHAYAVENGDVYFRVHSFKDYGKLSHQPLEELEAGARIEVGEIKEAAADFALWKAAKPGEPHWASPFSEGRPGWHIECSAMSRKYLGDQFDIHGGGQDLIFPHHENEIAQTECVTGKPMANYWLHNGFITINSEKMSKSLGNFFLLREILEKFDSETVRFYLLSVQYRSPLDFDDEKLQVAQKGLERLKNCYTAMMNGLKTASADNTAEGADLLSKVAAVEDAFQDAMNDDFNTALASAALFDMAREINTYLKQDVLDKTALQKAADVYTALLSIMGLDFSADNGANDGLVDDLMNLLIDLRKQARAEKNYAMADQIRNQLNEIGVVLEDTKQGTTWKLK